MQTTSNLTYPETVGALLWRNWTKGDYDTVKNLEAIRSSLEPLNQTQREDLLQQLQKVAGVSPASIDKSKDNFSRLRLEELLLIIQYSLYSFDSGSVAFSHFKIENFLFKSGLSPDLVYKLYPLGSKLGNVSLPSKN